MAIHIDDKDINVLYNNPMKQYVGTPFIGEPNIPDARAVTLEHTPPYNGEPYVPYLTNCYTEKGYKVPTLTSPRNREFHVRNKMASDLRKTVEPVHTDPKFSNLRVSPKPTNSDRVFTTIKQLTNLHTAIIDHDDTNDLFFTNRMLQLGYNHVMDDPDFYTPCRHTYIFNTMKGNIPYVLYPDNTPSTVQNKDMSGLSSVKKEYLCKMLSTDEETIEDLEGVFVLEYKEIIDPRYNGATYSTAHIMNYYRKSVDIYPGARFLTSTPEDSYQTAGKALYDRMKRHNHDNPNISGHSIYRVVTFIPKKDLEENIEVYVQHLGLVIGIGEIHDRIVHPTYQPYIEYHRKMCVDNKNGIYVEINNPYSVTRDYYYKLGKKILKIKSTNDPSLPAGVVMKHYVNGALIDRSVCTLEDMEAKLGIYAKYEDAETDGDYKSKQDRIYNEQRLKLDALKISNERVKMNNEHWKLLQGIIMIVATQIPKIVLKLL